MRHFKKGRKLSRERNQRRALYKSLASSFIMHGRIKTTLAKAKAVAPIIEKLISKAREKDLANYRQLLKFLPQKAVKYLVFEVAPKFASQKGGYTRIIKAGLRKSDAARLAILELVSK